MKASTTHINLFARPQHTLPSRVEGLACTSPYQLGRIISLQEIQRNIIKSPV
ncbi:hypothetical protein [Belliella pelovolcani]|uniref:Uncharacterized protein n=1 Tax=Belliella pelovolcani TaxID=529505 RepID=A0A1N7PSW8_9BACT|nr:hypothetical protein [Belliella pelovolcani]SIT13517.1 hypothetical protein SAMN05421761_12012 [Belliella pelovolcani]